MDLFRRVRAATAHAWHVSQELTFLYVAQLRLPSPLVCTSGGHRGLWKWRPPAKGR